MKSLILFLLCVAVGLAEVHKVRLSSAGSLRKRLIKAGKYGKFLQHHIHNKASGQMPFLDYFDDFYLGNITIGTPPQTLTVIPDTGFADLWVIGTECTSDACIGYPMSGYTKKRFDASASTTYHKIGDSFELFYGTDECSGYTADDVVSFAGLTVTKQTFGVATEINDAYGYEPIDGIMGLGWSGLAQFSHPTIMENMMPQLTHPIFTVWMDRSVQIASGGNGGMITYGDYDNEHCESNINWVPLTSKTYWQFQIDGFEIGTLKDSAKREVISDTGTSFIRGPSASIDAIAQEVGAVFDWYYRIYTITCTAMQTGPTLTFKINGNDYPIKAIEYVIDLNLGGGMCAITFFQIDGMGVGAQWILGDTFIRTYCNMHDMANARIGFSLAKHSQI